MYITATISIAVIIHVLFMIPAFIEEPLVILDNGNKHVDLWLPLETNLIECLFSIFFIKWARRVKACACTKHSTYLFAAMAALSLAETILSFNYYVYAFLYGAIAALVILNSIHFISKQHAIS